MNTDYFKELPASLGQAWRNTMTRISPVAVDTITTRFLLLFLFLLAIPLAAVIIFTFTLLTNHLEQSAREQIVLSKNLFQAELRNAEAQLTLLRNASPTTTEACQSPDHMLCMTVDYAQQQIHLNNASPIPLSSFLDKNPDWSETFHNPLNQNSFLERVNGKLFLLRKGRTARAEQRATFYGLPLNDHFIADIYRNQPNLQCYIWIISRESQVAQVHWNAKAPGNPIGVEPWQILETIYRYNVDPNQIITTEFKGVSYQLSHENLYNLSHAKVGRVIYLLPLRQTKLLLSNYYIGIYIIMVASLLFSVLLAMMAGRTITQPLLKLIRQVNTLSRENVMKENDEVLITGVLEIRQLGEAFNRMIKRLKQEHKLKDDFVATLTHDLKVPLLAEKQTLTYFLKEAYGPLNTEQNEVLDTLKSSNASCLALVNGLLEVYRYDSGEVSLLFESFNLVKLMEDTALELQPLAREKAIELEVKCNISADDPAGRVYADALEIKRVLHNLISNAITNTPVHGKITCNVTNEAQYGSQTIYKVSSLQYTTLKYPVNLKDRLLVTIQDSGIGFSHDDLSSLFKQFAASKGRNPMSIGLGLYNCHQVVQAHNGLLWVESTEGQGSVVSFIIPRNEQAAQDRRVYHDRRRHS